MRHLVWLILVTACEAGGPVIELDVDMVIDDSFVAIYPRELDRTCTCTSNWPAPGTCAGSTDVIGCSCDPAPASCIDRFELLGGGEVLATAVYDDPEIGSAWLSLADVSGVVDEVAIDGCGGRAVIPVSDGVFPIPTIDDVTATDSEVTISWSATPAGTSSVASLSDGFVAELCHDDDFDGVDTLTRPGFDWEFDIRLRTLNRTIHTTELGEVRVWKGGTAQTTVSL